VVGTGGGGGATPISSDPIANSEVRVVITVIPASTRDPSLSPWVIDTAAQQETTQGAGAPQEARTQLGRTTAAQS
jgi:hypothetical protein